MDACGHMCMSMNKLLIANTVSAYACMLGNAGRRALVVMARGPVVTKKGVAFGKTEKVTDKLWRSHLFVTAPFVWSLDVFRLRGFPLSPSQFSLCRCTCLLQADSCLLPYP